MGTITEELYDWTFDLNVKGLLFTVPKALPPLPAEGGKLRDPGIGEHNIEPAFLLLDLCEKPIKISEVRHVSSRAHHIHCDFLYRHGQLCLTAAGNEDICAFVQKRLCGRETNASVTTGNECDFSFKPAHVPPSLILRVPDLFIAL
jgi:hypothetical protein